MIRLYEMNREKNTLIVQLKKQDNDFLFLNKYAASLYPVARDLYLHQLRLLAVMLALYEQQYGPIESQLRQQIIDQACASMASKIDEFLTPYYQKTKQNLVVELQRQKQNSIDSDKFDPAVFLKQTSRLFDSAQGLFYQSKDGQLLFDTLNALKTQTESLEINSVIGQVIDSVAATDKKTLKALSARTVTFTGQVVHKTSEGDIYSTLSTSEHAAHSKARFMAAQRIDLVTRDIYRVPAPIPVKQKKTNKDIKPINQIEWAKKAIEEKSKGKPNRARVLLTSIPTREDSNKQRAIADLSLTQTHELNISLFKDSLSGPDNFEMDLDKLLTNNFYSIAILPFNGFGQEPSLNSADPLVVDACLMADLTFLRALAANQQENSYPQNIINNAYEGLANLYLGYLQEKTLSRTVSTRQFF